MGGRKGFGIRGYAPWVVVLFLVNVLVLAFFFMSSSPTDTVRSSTRNSTTTAKAKHGLYTSSTSVEEMASNAHFNEFLSSSKRAKIIVFYASWCPHCRHFAPVFTRFADKMQEFSSSGIADIDEDLVLSFAAVDCPTIGAPCEVYNIGAYPTVLAFNIPDVNNTGTEEVFLPPKRFIGGLKELDKFLRKTVFRGGELDRWESIKDSTNKNGTVEVSLEEMLSGRQSHITTPAVRRHDAAASFLYFLSQELPKDLNQEQTLVLLRMWSLWETIMRQVADNDMSIKRVLKLGRSIINEHKHLPTWPTKSLRRIVKYSVPVGDMRWESCGRAENFTIARKLNGFGLWPFGNTESAATHVDGEAGYSCGLWMMFHLFTLHGLSTPSISNSSLITSSSSSSNQVALRGAAVDVSSEDKMSVTELKDTIHGFVENFFRCHNCRAHFLHSYRQCVFGHCTTESEGYPQLQYWLFLFHNLVANRIVLAEQCDFPTYTTGVCGVDQDVIMRIVHAKRWPTRERCAECYTSSSDQQAVEAGQRALHQQQLREEDPHWHVRQRQEQKQKLKADSASVDKLVLFRHEDDIEGFLVHVMRESFDQQHVLQVLASLYTV